MSTTTKDDPYVEALNRKIEEQKTRIDALEDENERLSERLSEIEAIVDPDPGQVQYDQLSSDQKVRKIREKLVNLASNTDGRGSLGYKDVMQLFDGHPSAGHCYDLMERAATSDGFSYNHAGNGKGQKRIRVDVAAVNDERHFHGVNNGSGEVTG